MLKFLQRPSAPLPNEKQFDPYGGCLDAQWAWKNFGELSLQQAYNLFLTNPGCRQEDFMFMGPEAFAYYFPVIDRYLREVTGDDDEEDCYATILGQCVEGQFGSKGRRLPGSLIAEIESLSQFIQSDLVRYSPSEKDQRRIAKAWAAVDQRIAAYGSRE